MTNRLYKTNIKGREHRFIASSIKDAKRRVLHYSRLFALSRVKDDKLSDADVLFQQDCIETDLGDKFSFKGVVANSLHADLNAGDEVTGNVTNVGEVSGTLEFIFTLVNKTTGKTILKEAELGLHEFLTKYVSFASYDATF